MKKRAITTLSGLALLAVGILFLFHYWRISSFTRSAITSGCAGMCYSDPNRSLLTISHPKIIPLSTSTAISAAVFFTNIDEGSISCQPAVGAIESIDYEAHLSAAGMKISPEATQKTTESTTYGAVATDELDPGRIKESNATWTWIAIPEKPGTYTFHMRVSAAAQGCQLFNLDDTFAISVVDVFGLSAPQLKILGMIGTFFGSSLTVPGLLAMMAGKRIVPIKFARTKKINT